MYRRLISLFLTIAWINSVAFAQETVPTWLNRMGCNELLARYLEDKLESGTSKERGNAVRELANVYAILLSRSEGEENKEILQRAIALFDRIPEAGTVDLKLQLYRATFIASEQILERYRLRISEREDAELAVVQLKDIAENLEKLRTKLQKSIKASRSPSEKKKQNLGMATSYLAWVHYYIAWFQDNSHEAEKAARLFALLLNGDRPSLQSVSLDFKKYEIGARAILGVALSKSLMGDSVGSQLWFEELDDPSVWGTVRDIVPLWRFYLLVDDANWSEILRTFENLADLDKTIVFRVAAVHALENASTSDQAKEVAKRSLVGLIQLGQLGIVSSIVGTYGNTALEKDGFITKFIAGDFAYRNIKDSYKSDLPPKETDIQKEFMVAATLFREAIDASDAINYPALVEDCQYMLGLSLYYASEFRKASEVFQVASQGSNTKQALWMAIVSLNYLDDLNQAESQLKEELGDTYIARWPNTKQASQLILYRADANVFDASTLEDLLAIDHSDPLYEDAQRRASRTLFQMWRVAKQIQQPSVGNKYISIAMPLMIADARLADDLHANEVCAIRALRVLEVALHEEVGRKVAAANAIEVLDKIQERGLFPLDEYNSEINYRKMLVLLHDAKLEIATELLLNFMEDTPSDFWIKPSALSLWNYWMKEKVEIDNSLLYKVGSAILAQLKEQQIGSSEFVAISNRTARAAYDLYLQTSDTLIGDDALQLSRILVKQNPLMQELLVLNAELEMTLGDMTTAYEQWKKIASGTRPGTLHWIRAKYYEIKLLAGTSPTKAIDLLNQHLVLYPSYGEEPYGSQLRLLHSELQEHGYGN